MTEDIDTLAIDMMTDRSENFLICFAHDHLKEVTRIQCKIIEGAILGHAFISRETADDLRVSAATYLAYAQHIEKKLAMQN